MIKQNWKLFSCSIQGQSHIKNYIPCQDSSTVFTLGDMVIGIVADGAGSAKYSQIGSAMAVDIATVEIKNMFSNRRLFSFFGMGFSWSQNKLEAMFIRIIKKIREAIANDIVKEESIHDYATTLIIFIACPNRLVVLQLGDGFVVCRFQEEYKLITSFSKGEFANSTYFITDNNFESNIYINIINSSPKFICASTDGLENLAISRTKDNNSPYAPFFSVLENCFYLDSSECIDIRNWLIGNPTLNQKTSDDKTLVIAGKL